MLITQKGSVFTFLISILGSEILEIPISFYYSGIWGALSIFLINALLCIYANMLLTKISEKTKIFTFVRIN